MGWVPRPISAELDRIAAREGLTRSKTIAVLLEEAVNQRLHVQHAVLLPAVIDRSVTKAMSRYFARTERLLVRGSLEINQTRTLTTNILGRQPGMTPEKLDKILDRSLDKAKADISRRAPPINDQIAEDQNVGKEEAELRPGG